MPTSALPRLEVVELGRRPYAETWAMQHALVGAIARGDAPETLLLVEHDPVITLGRKAGAALNVLDAGPWPVFETERGGDATWHGPGQLVGYPLLRLADGERDLHRYLRNLESLLILTLADLGLAAGRSTGLTGVWVGPLKLASLGVAVRRWVTYHGFALNVNVAAGGFERLNPCGLAANTMACASSCLGREVALAEVVSHLLPHLKATLGRVPVAAAEAAGHG